MRRAPPKAALTVLLSDARERIVGSRSRLARSRVDADRLIEPTARLSDRSERILRRNNCAIERIVDIPPGSRIDRYGGEDDRQNHEDHSQPLGGASQEIRGATGAHQPARAPTAANTQAATFGALQEDQGNERRGNNALEDGKKDEQRHERSLASLRGHLGGRLP